VGAILASEGVRKPVQPRGPSNGDKPFVRAGRPITFLVVEDEALIALDIEAMVREAGGRPLSLAATADEAEKLATVLEPDIILMDVRLKGPRDGIAAAHAIRARRDVPIVFVTGNEESTTLERIRVFNGTAPVGKPVRATALISAVLAALRDGGSGPVH